MSYLLPQKKKMNGREVVVGVGGVGGEKEGGGVERKRSGHRHFSYPLETGI